MTINKSIFLVLLAIAFTACQSKYTGIPEEYHILLDSAFTKAGENTKELQTALTKAPQEQKEGMAFLISYMPESDLTSLSAHFLLENADYAYKARKKYAWCAALPDSIFLNEVLPYANISETRDSWRPDFYERFSKYAEGKADIVDAIMAIARNIEKEVGVKYNTKRSVVDISPFQAIKEQMATCTGLSILLTDAYRAVGIPSRIAGTAMWTNYKGNHTWNEVWINGNWHFIEYYPDTLDQAWFLADAGKADPENMLHWIYAASYKPTGMPYYAAPDESVMEVVDIKQLPDEVKSDFQHVKENSEKHKIEHFAYGHNVTPRYIALYEESLKNNKLAEDELWANVVVFANPDISKSESRLKCRVEVTHNNNAVTFGYSPQKTDDMNQFLKFKLKKATEYQFIVTNPENGVNQSFTIKTNNNDTQDIQLILK